MKNHQNIHSPLQYALFQAAKVGNIKLMKEFIEIGADPFALDEENYTPLHYAKIQEPIKTAELLFELTNNSNQYNQKGR